VRFYLLSQFTRPNPRVLALVTAALLYCHTAYGELRAVLSTDKIEELDSVQLIIRDIGSREVQTPDLSSLREDFQVLGVNTSSQYQFINGRAQSWVDYQITLQPTKTGTLAIGPISIGTQQTQPLTLQVRTLSTQARQDLDQRVFYELETSADVVYVQSQLLLTRRLFYAEGVQLYGGQLEAPTIPGAQVFTLGEGTSSTINRNGRLMGVFVQRYAIFPERSGRLTIANDSVTASVPFAGASGSKRKSVKVRTGSKEIQVKAIPKQYPADQPWLPATRVTITQRHQPGLDQPVAVGDTIHQEITVTVVGNTGASVTPDENTPDPSVFKTYPQPPSIENDFSGATLLGRRVEITDLVPIVGGAHELPRRTITWWNTETEQVMTTTTDTVVVSVVGNAIATREALPVEAPNANPPAQQLGGTVQSHANTLSRWSLIAAALLALIALAFWRRWRRASSTKQNQTAAAPRQPNDPTRVSLKRLQASLEADSPQALRPALIRFLISHYQGNQHQAVAAFRASSATAAEFWDALGAACYADEPFTEAHRRSGQKALEALKAQAETIPQTNISVSALPELYLR
jgi:hypothetical protein